MKKINRIIIFAIILIVLGFICANTFLVIYEKNKQIERPYRVEINRIAYVIDEQGLTAVDLENYEHVIAVQKVDDINQSIKTNNDYMLININDEFYCFEYSYENKNDVELYLLVNGLLIIASLFVIGLLLYIKIKIIIPFQKFSLAPYELSKGNLTIPLKEEKSQYFGKFVWGIDLLRENMEKQKIRELELEKQKKTLLLSLSHDIKTPLSAIKLYSKALSMGIYENKDKENEIAESINLKADEIEHYISEIVKTSNEDLFKYDVNIETFCLSKLIDNIQEYYSEKLNLVHTKFIIGKYIDCMIKVDFDRMVEVIQNVIENAIKYGDGNEIELLFSEEDGCILISIKNSGERISDNDLPHIFESFYRGTNTNGKNGSGLGLYICKELMHNMNGDIFATTQENGMMITIVVPMA